MRRRGEQLELGGPQRSRNATATWLCIAAIQLGELEDEDQAVSKAFGLWSSLSSAELERESALYRERLGSNRWAQLGQK